MEEEEKGIRKNELSCSYALNVKKYVLKISFHLLLCNDARDFCAPFQNAYCARECLVSYGIYLTCV